jgi:DinB superfamily
MHRLISKPTKGEFPSYAIKYIKLLPEDGLVLDHLESNFQVVKSEVFYLPEKLLLYRYNDDKWTIKEILVHIIDDERIYGYRALRFARNDKTILPGFEQYAYAINSKANERSIVDIMEEYEYVRKSTISLFKYLPDEALTRSGIADDKQVSVRALVYHIAGHELHHLNIIKEKYLNNSGK